MVVLLVDDVITNYFSISRLPCTFSFVHTQAALSGAHFFGYLSKVCLRIVSVLGMNSRGTYYFLSLTCRQCPDRVHVEERCRASSNVQWQSPIMVRWSRINELPKTVCDGSIIGGLTRIDFKTTDTTNCSGLRKPVRSDMTYSVAPWKMDHPCVSFRTDNFTPDSLKCQQPKG